jgi:ADP-ribose pyrophosphatase YjhB (NUDIX family)
MDVVNFLENGDLHFLPNLSIDIVVVGYEKNELKCLLLKLSGKWVLPGGYIGRQESVNAAALRILKDRTALEKPHLNFLSVFGEEDRNFGGQFKEFVNAKGLPWRDTYWVNSRFVTLSYYSLVNIRETFPSPGTYDEEVAWCRFDDLPEMWLDHRKIVMEARERMKKDIKTGQISHQLLPDRFTMPELHQLHQRILEEELDRSRFQKKMLATGKFERLPKLLKSTPGRNPFLYRVISDPDHR